MEGIQTEYGPGQIETNLVYTDALDAADDAARLKYAAKEVARKHGKIASFMPKPFTEHSGSSQHLHISLWRGDEPAFAPDDGAENELALHAIAGLLEHLPSITLFGAHSVNAYRRFTPDSFAPATVTWSRDNRSAAVRSLIEPDPSATRIELRSGASDANPYWLIASALAAVVAGLEAKRNAPPVHGGNLYTEGVPLPESLGVAIELATRDDTILEILGADSVLDFAALARSEWVEYLQRSQRLGTPALPDPLVTAPRFGVWAPVYGNHGARNHPHDAPDASYRRTRDLLLRAERAGFDSTLLAEHVIHPSNTEDDVLETWSTIAALAEATSRIELIGAVKPLLFNPLVFAKIAANIADIADGDSRSTSSPDGSCPSWRGWDSTHSNTTTATPTRRNGSASSPSCGRASTFRSAIAVANPR